MCLEKRRVFEAALPGKRANYFPWERKGLPGGPGVVGRNYIE